MNRFQYPVLLRRAKEGGYVVTCRDLPQLVTQGDSVHDALEDASDAMDEIFATYLTEGMDFPARCQFGNKEAGASAGYQRNVNLEVPIVGLSGHGIRPSQARGEVHHCILAGRCTDQNQSIEYG